MKSWNRLRDVFLEVLIAVVLVTGGIVYVVSRPTSRLNWGWIALVGNTLVVFGFLISWFRGEWRRLRLWAVLVVLLLGHTAAYIFVLIRIHDFPLAYYVVLNSMELALYTPVIRKLMTANRD